MLTVNVSHVRLHKKKEAGKMYVRKGGYRPLAKKRQSYLDRRSSHYQYSRPNLDNLDEIKKSLKYA